MEGKIVITIMSIILVVNFLNVEGVCKVKPRFRRVRGRGRQEPPNSEMVKLLNNVCAPTTYKDVCLKSLEPVARNPKATPQTFVQAGVKLALIEVAKASKLTDTLFAKAKSAKDPKMATSAIKSCKHLLEETKDRLEQVLGQACDVKNFKDAAELFNIRIELSDANTFTTSCVDDFGEVGAPEIQQIVKNAVTPTNQFVVNMLDVVTIHNQALGGNTLPQPALTRRLLRLF